MEGPELYEWIWKWRMVSIVLLVFGAVGGMGPFVIDQSALTGPLSFLNDMSNVMKGSEYYFGIIFVFGWVLLTCIGDFEINVQKKDYGVKQ